MSRGTIRGGSARRIVFNLRSRKQARGLGNHGAAIQSFFLFSVGFGFLGLRFSNAVSR